MTDGYRSPFIKGKVVYQIYPRSFADGNGDGVGDIQGIIEHLNYLNSGHTGRADSLGINMIWLSPFYPSPMADFGYDISDYCDVDPIYGTLDDFKRLVEESHRRGVKLMIDFVPDHSSDQHPWFLESKSSRTNPKRDWYIWKDAKPDGSPPNNWLSVFGGSAWEWDETTGQYFMHSFLKQQPDLNWENPELRAQMMDAIRFWLKMGVDGIRVDAVDWMAKDRQFRDNPPNPHYKPGIDDPYHEYERLYNQEAPQLFEYLHEMATVVKEAPDGFMVTETYPDRRNIAQRYHALYEKYLAEVSAPFNFEGIKLPWSAMAFKTFIDEFQAGLKPHHLPIYVLGNHDNSRLASRIGPKAARTAALMQLTLPGVAFIYYGDELGMEDVPIPFDRVQDPFEKRVPGLGLGRDPERTPMQWTPTRHAGFSSVEPWLPVGNDYHDKNVRYESRNPTSILSLYRKLIHLRNTSPIIQHGNYIPLDLDNPYTFGYLREYSGQAFAVILNFTGHNETIRTQLGTGFIMYSAQLYEEGGLIDLTEYTLPPHEGYLVALDVMPGV
jgi:alpha-glucosidase